MIDQCHRPAVLFTDHGKPARVGAACIPDDDHCITFSGKPDCFFLSHFRSSAYCIKDFEICTDFFCDFAAGIPIFLRPGRLTDHRQRQIAPRAVKIEPFLQFLCALQDNRPGAEARDGPHFRVLRRADDEAAAAFALRLLYDPVDFFHKRTRCIDDFKAPCGQFLLHRLFHAVRPQDDRLTGLRLVR